MHARGSLPQRCTLARSPTWRSHTSLVSLLDRARDGQSLLNLGELNERRGVLRADLALMFAPRVCPLQRTAHGDCDRNGIASMGCRTHQIEFRSRSNVTGKAIAAKPIYDRHETARANRRSRGGYVQLEELPVARRDIVALLTLDHDLGGHELKY